MLCVVCVVCVVCVGGCEQRGDLPMPSTMVTPARAKAQGKSDDGDGSGDDDHDSGDTIVWTQCRCEASP